MKAGLGLLVLAASLALAPLTLAATQTINLAGSNHTGYFAISRLKSFGAANAPNTNPADPNNISEYPFFVEGGIYRTIAAAPLSASSVYAEESSFTVQNKTLTDANFSVTDIGDIQYDSSLVTGSGTEIISPASFTLLLDSHDLSPRYSTHNTGTGNGNFSFDYIITPSNFSGAGLTFQNGQLTSIDFSATVSIDARFSAGSFTISPPFVGTIAFSGNSFAYSVDQTNAVSQPFSLSNLHFVANRAGSVAAVVPEPTASVVAAGGLIAAAFRRRRLS